MNRTTGDESGAPVEQAEATLLKKAEELKRFEARLTAFSNEDPRLGRYRESAQSALDEGRFDDAADILAEAETVVDTAADVDTATRLSEDIIAAMNNDPGTWPHFRWTSALRLSRLVQPI